MAGLTVFIQTKILLGRKTTRCRISAMQRYEFWLYPLSPSIHFPFPYIPTALSTFQNGMPKKTTKRWIPWRNAKQRPPKVRRFWIWCRDIERRCPFSDFRRWWCWMVVVFWEGRFVLEGLPPFFWGGESFDWWLVKKNDSTLPCWNWDWLFATGYFF